MSEISRHLQRFFKGLFCTTSALLNTAVPQPYLMLICKALACLFIDLQGISAENGLSQKGMRRAE